MTYEVGAHIDLTYLNKKREVAAAVPRKSALKEAIETGQEAGSTLFEVGTQFIFDQTQKKLMRRINVQFA